MEGLQDLKSSIGDLTVIIKQFKDGMDGRLKAMDERTSSLETKIRDQLVSQVGPKEMPTNKWSWARLCFAVATKDWSVAPFEKAEIDAYREKTMQAANFGLGGSFIPPQYSTEIIELFKAALILPQLGVRIMDGLVGSPVMIPKIASGSTGYWVSPEGSSITVSDIGTGRLDLQPRTCGALVKISNNLIALANPSMEAMVRADLVRALNEKVTAAFFQGTGTLGEPLGLENQVPAIPTTTYTTTDAMTKMTSVKNMVKTIDEANALSGKLAFAMNPTAYWILEGLNTGVAAGSFILTPRPTENTFETVCGYRVVKSTLINSSNKGYFGNWDDTILGIWQGLDIASSSETSTAFQNNELWIRALMMVDVGVRRVGSLTITSAAIS